jgi:hypothetical protein
MRDYAQFSEHEKRFIAMVHEKEDVYAYYYNDFSVLHKANYFASTGITLRFFAWTMDQAHQKYCEKCSYL